MPRPVEVLRRDLVRVARDLTAAQGKVDALLDRRADLYRALIGSGVSKTEVARIAGVTAQAVQFGLNRLDPPSQPSDD